ncbi:hypothetical protein Tco_0420638 [Tanacetum coccineum]
MVASANFFCRAINTDSPVVNHDEAMSMVMVAGSSLVSGTMATTSNPYITREDKGKMIIAEPEITAISDLRPIHCNKTIEAVVYRKWTSKHVHTQQPMKYCCILMEKQVCTQLPQLLL